ncbi:MAG: hypothetical protein GEU94_11645 [Micromonosporaceae bacterium]|nr:hypothetical protein [Micromonosporaceae bacterium]
MLGELNYGQLTQALYFTEELLPEPSPDVPLEDVAALAAKSVLTLGLSTVIRLDESYRRMALEMLERPDTEETAAAWREDTRDWFPRAEHHKRAERWAWRLAFAGTVVA